MPPSRRSKHVSRVTKPTTTTTAAARRTRSSLRANTNNKDDSIDGMVGWEIKVMPVTRVATNSQQRQQRNGYYDQDESDDDDLDDYDRVRDKVDSFVAEMTGVLPAGYRICFKVLK
ncbi:hypothetical protein TWF225_008345 [Orbilia oligospora]|nr:hypothetical protein TWF225_008345 [Orbilia oligospora]KAF3254791.1 hypothetical protein TWF128_006102 [Orbilia oligospora]KAF3269786.1 hypothetical protein TWF217_008151 [Orbilia oligospora]KAF3278381.1 hypothetical protein TWF132_001165 [Orbilia oligospora]